MWLCWHSLSWPSLDDGHVYHFQFLAAISYAVKNPLVTNLCSRPRSKILPSQKAWIFLRQKSCICVTEPSTQASNSAPHCKFILQEAGSALQRFICILHGWFCMVLYAFLKLNYPAYDFCLCPNEFFISESPYKL